MYTNSFNSEWDLRLKHLDPPTQTSADLINEQEIFTLNKFIVFGYFSAFLVVVNSASLL